MSSSLREQLLKAGLVSREQARDADQAKRKQVRHKGGKKAAAKPEKNAASLQADKRRAAQAERDRTLNRGREEARRRKALDAQLKQVIEGEAQNRPGADLAHHFQRGSKLKHVYVTAEQQRLLSEGRLAIAGFHGRHYLISPSVAEKLSALDPKLFVFRHDPGVPDPDGDHPVPDDLTW